MEFLVCMYASPSLISRPYIGGGGTKVRKVTLSKTLECGQFESKKGVNTTFDYIVSVSVATKGRVSDMIV